MNKKIIPPIIVVICILLYYTIGLIILINIKFPTIIKIIAIIVSIIITVVFIIVLLERIKEIRSGEENDLSKY
jgi:hypothetical protein